MTMTWPNQSAAANSRRAFRVRVAGDLVVAPALHRRSPAAVAELGRWPAFKYMANQLSDVLARNEVIWNELEKRGLRAGASFGVDFEFYATKPEERDQILPI